MSAAESLPPAEGSAVETVQSLIVAFVLAMTFRGFVTEGFVIPTGSMAPTLMGQHIKWHSDQSGYEFSVDAKRPLVTLAENMKYNMSNDPSYAMSDPMLGRPVLWRPQLSTLPSIRMGDRILVLKCLFPFFRPNRFEVVVFKNPTDPHSDAGNYIKRLIGLPGESIWLVDGDVFVGSAKNPDAYDDYKIQRKDEYVQRSMWQPIHNSDFVAVNAHNSLTGPWRGDGWRTDTRDYTCTTAEESTLRWDTARWPLDDYVSYNMFDYNLGTPRYDVIDLRVRATLVPEQAGLETTLELRGRDHVFEFALEGAEAVLRFRLASELTWIDEVRTPIDTFEAGRMHNVEFWHVDQSMSIYIDGELVGDPLLYDWGPAQRVTNAFDRPFPDWLRSGRLADSRPYESAELSWHFKGSPVTVHRLAVDRDIYYQPNTLRGPNIPAGMLDQPAFGTHPTNLAILGDDDFFMLGDNSEASSDSRLWGKPHPIVATQISDASFVVHRKLLLGKAWVVYFPAPYGLSGTSRSTIPDFGHLRFIR